MRLRRTCTLSPRAFASGAAVSRQRSSGLEYDRVDADPVEPFDQPFGLPPSVLVQVDAGRPARQPLAGGVGATVSNQEQRRHAA